MKSPISGKPMILHRKKEEILYKNKKIIYNFIGYYCYESNHFFTTTKLDTINMNNVRRNYRKLVNENK